MTRPALALTAAALVAVPAPGRPDALADLEHEHARLFDRVAPAVVAISNGTAIGAGFAVVTHGAAGAIVGVVFAGIVIASAIARRRFRPKVVPGEGVADGLEGQVPRLRVVRGSDR